MQAVRQFLGLVGYYRKYIPNFAAVARPLYQLTERGHEFKWTVECIHAFHELKSWLLSAPILSFPDFDRPYTDRHLYPRYRCLSVWYWSSVVAGPWRSGESGGPQKSHTQQSREEVLRHEERATGIICHLRKHCRPYLLGRSFTLRTDHSSLQWLYNMKEPEGQLARWLEQLQEYNFAVIHRKGSNHGNADALSRVSADQSEDCKIMVPRVC